MKRAAQKWIVGIDEVGRGALAGPVVVAAALVPSGYSFRNRSLGKLKDSKKLTALQRESWFAYVKGVSAIRFAFARVYPRGIERRNISNAANYAAKKAFDRLLGDAAKGSNGAKGERGAVKIFLDGGLFLGSGEQPGNAKTLIKGDEKINAVKIASIVAKVHRDRFMKRLAKKHPVYGFDVHKGYGTKMHRAAIFSEGPCEAHRVTFITKLTPTPKLVTLDRQSF